MSRPFVSDEDCAGNTAFKVFHESRLFRDTKHEFSPSLRRLQREQPQARPTGFSQITNHGIYGRSLRRGCARVAEPKTENRRPDRRARREATACLPTIRRDWTRLDAIGRLSCCPFRASLPAISHYGLLSSVHYCPALSGIARVTPPTPPIKGPRTVRRSRSVSRRAPLAATPVALQAASTTANAK